MNDTVDVAVEDFSLQVEIDLEGDESDEEDDSDLIEVPRPAWKPDISHLTDAITKLGIGGTKIFCPVVGDRIVIDYTNLKPFGTWLDTRCWVVDTIGRDDDLGYVGLYDPVQKQKGCTNWIAAAKKGLVIKLIGAKDNFVINSSSTSRKSARRAVAKAIKEQNKAAESEKAKSVCIVDGVAQKKVGRGRPKGSLNSRTAERLISAGYDPTTMTRQSVDEVMTKIRKDEYEAAKAERKRVKELEKGKA